MGKAKICKHNKRLFYCRECKGGAFCEHNKIKYQCKECKGSQICEHNTNKSSCIKCDGGNICEHNKRRSICIDCDGGSICKHKLRISRCLECGGNEYCEHKKRKNDCVDCEGGSICEHKKRRRFCVDCDGILICQHKKRRMECFDCNPELYLIQTQRKRIGRILKDNQQLKEQKTIDYLDCSILFFYNYIKSKLTKEMLENGFHIDHIKPVSSFNLENEMELKKCCHWSNLQPLLIEDNLRKSNKWTNEDEEHWKNNIIQI